MSSEESETSEVAPLSWRRMVAAVAMVAACVVLLGVLSRAGMSRELFMGRGEGGARRRVLRVWDWWSPSTNEKFAVYFEQVQREWKQLHPDVDLELQFVPFQQYEQKMATGLVGASPPDVFQSSVYFAEGFYDRGMLLPLNPFLDRERAERERRKATGQTVDAGEIVDRESYLEAGWRHNTKTDGTVFGVPQILDSNCLAWNLQFLHGAMDDPDIRSMFETRADGSPDPDKLRWNAIRDWEQFRRVARKLTRYDAQGNIQLDAQGDPVQAGFAIHAHGSGAGPFMPWCAANGSNFQDADGTRAIFADAKGERAMRFLLDLYWNDHVSPPFRRQMSDEEVFNQGHVACVAAGTWSGKLITRNTDGKLKFDFTAFPPGPDGSGPTTLTWGNMLVISRRSRQPELAWEYIKFITSLKGARRLLGTTEQNSPRKDFYQTPDWAEMVRTHPYNHNVPLICASGKKLRNTQINAVDNAVQPIFEALLFHYPEIEHGSGPYPSVLAGLQAGASAVDRVYQRYNEQVAYWHRGNGL